MPVRVRPGCLLIRLLIWYIWGWYLKVSWHWLLLIRQPVKCRNVSPPLPVTRRPAVCGWGRFTLSSHVSCVMKRSISGILPTLPFTIRQIRRACWKMCIRDRIENVCPSAAPCQARGQDCHFLYGKPVWNGIVIHLWSRKKRNWSNPRNAMSRPSSLLH